MPPDDNECVGEGSGNNCHENADCTNEPAGSFTCTCKDGYTGDGVNTCNGKEGPFYICLSSTMKF